MEKSNPRKYFRLTKAERASIERALDKRVSARAMARDLGRSPSTIADEVKRNRTVCKGPGIGERVTDPPDGGVICHGVKFLGSDPLRFLRRGFSPA